MPARIGLSLLGLASAVLAVATLLVNTTRHAEPSMQALVNHKRLVLGGGEVALVPATLQETGEPLIVAGAAAQVLGLGTETRPGH
jgi:hypothetical protein